MARAARRPMRRRRVVMRSEKLAGTLRPRLDRPQPELPARAGAPELRHRVLQESLWRSPPNNELRNGGQRERCRRRCKIKAIRALTAQ